jgi:hypothetical protein
MQSMTLRSRVGRDGILRLEVPVGLADADTEVMVIVQPLNPPADKAPEDRSPEALGWPPGFFEQTFGCLRDELLVREPQGEYETRDELR